MKEIYIVTQYDRPVIAMEGEKDAAALAEKLGGRVEPVQLVERSRESSVLGQLVECRKATTRGLTDDDFAGGVVR